MKGCPYRGTDVWCVYCQGYPPPEAEGILVGDRSNPKPFNLVSERDEESAR